MRTNTPAATSAANKVKPITVTIDGELAELLRTEAKASGLIPLSLVKQRLRLAGMLTEDTPAAKEFRMDIAEKVFREAGRYTALQNWDPADVPAGCVTARVRPDTAGNIRTLAGKMKSPVWAVACVFAVIGERTLGDDAAAATLKTNTTACVWRCIHRDEKKFTETIPVFFGDALEHTADTASAMRRDLGDWLGSLIELGAGVFFSRASLGFMTSGDELELLAKSAELESIKQALASGEGGAA